MDDLPYAVETTLSVTHQDYGWYHFRYIPTNQTQDFVLTRVDRHLAGRVVDVDGNPIEDVIVSVISEDRTSEYVSPTATTNFRGIFWLKNIRRKRVSIDVLEMLGPRGKIFGNVETNRDDVVFVLEPPVIIKHLTPEQEARRKYAKMVREYGEAARERLKQLDGKSAPELDVTWWLHGEPVTLAELRGKVVVLHFWQEGNWIDPRLEFIRFLNALKREYGKDGVAFIAIHESTAQVDGLKKRIKEKEAAYRIAVDKESSVIGANGVTFDKYAIQYYTTNLIVIDKKGFAHTYVQDVNLEETIRRLILDEPQ